MGKCVDFEDLKQCVDLGIAHGMTLADFRIHMEEWTDFVDGYRWRSCKDELPKVKPEKIYVDEYSYYQSSEECLVWIAEDTAEDGIIEHCGIARLCMDDGIPGEKYWHPTQQWTDSPEVMAWMPLPTAYKEDK